MSDNHLPHGQGDQRRRFWFWAALESSCPPLEELIPRLHVIGLREQRGDGGMFTTLVAGRISSRPGQSRAVNAGHPAPIDIATGREIALPQGPLLGVFEGEHWHSAALPALGDGMLLYTDGLIEGRVDPGSQERWGVEHLLATLARERDAGRPARELALRLIRQATESHGDELPDDVAILIVR